MSHGLDSISSYRLMLIPSLQKQCLSADANESKALETGSFAFVCFCQLRESPGGIHSCTAAFLHKKSQMYTYKPTETHTRTLSMWK